MYCQGRRKILNITDKCVCVKWGGGDISAENDMIKDVEVFKVLLVK